MKIVIRANESEGFGFNIHSLQVMESLTFVTISNHPVYYPLLISLVKDKVVHSFEPKENVIKVSIRTKYVEDIVIDSEP